MQSSLWLICLGTTAHPASQVNCKNTHLYPCHKGLGLGWLAVAFRRCCNPTDIMSMYRAAEDTSVLRLQLLVGMTQALVASDVCKGCDIANRQRVTYLEDFICRMS